MDIEKVKSILLDLLDQVRDVKQEIASIRAEYEG